MNYVRPVALILIFIFVPAVVFGCRQPVVESAARSKVKAPDKPTPPQAPSAQVTVNVIDAATARALANVPVGVDDVYLTTDAGGSVGVRDLTAKDITVSARAWKHAPYAQRHRLGAGENTITVSLAPEADGMDGQAAPVYQRRAYLTIDDGPSATWTPAVLDILKRAQAPATFFLVGRRAAERPDVVRRIYLEGHAIGNHTFSHDYDDIYSGAPGNLTASFANNGRLLEEIIGFAPAIARPPGGAEGNFRPGWQKVVTGAGYTTVLWNVSTGDGSTQTTGPQMVDNAKRYLDRLELPDPAVILMHDTGPPIIEALPEIIAEVRRRGFELSTVRGELREPGLIIGPMNL